MDEQARVVKLEERFNNHLIESNSKDIDILSGMATLNATINSQPDLIANKIMEKIDEKYVSKEHALNLISCERAKSDERYLLVSQSKAKWNDYCEEHSSKDLDTLSKKIKVWGFFQALIVGIISFIIGAIIRSGSFISGFIK